MKDKQIYIDIYIYIKMKFTYKYTKRKVKSLKIKKIIMFRQLKIIQIITNCMQVNIQENIF